METVLVLTKRAGLRRGDITGHFPKLKSCMRKQRPMRVACSRMYHLVYHVFSKARLTTIISVFVDLDRVDRRNPRQNIKANARSSPPLGGMAGHADRMLPGRRHRVGQGQFAEQRY